MTEPRLVLLLAWKIAEILSKSRPGDDCTPFAQDVILEVAAWLRKRNVRVRASVEIAGDLEREINQAQPEPEGPTDEEIMRLMPQQMHEDLAAAARALAEHAGTISTSATGIMRIMLNRHAVDLARAVLARWGRSPQ
jgi:hypothetical protein